MLLGKGSFGKVHAGVHKLTKELAAVKLCDKRKMTEAKTKKCLSQEVRIMKRLHGHHNIIQLLEVVQMPAQVVLVMQFAPNGDVLKYVRQRWRLEVTVAKEFFKQLVDGVHYIHEMRVVHRDIKLENLLIDAFGCLKIADFGVATVYTPGEHLADHAGTPSYMAPEILCSPSAPSYEGPPVDVWSCGVCLFAMVSGRHPFKGHDMVEAIANVWVKLPAHFAPDVIALLRKVLIADPSQRATVSEVLADPWLKGVTNRAEEIYGVLPPPVLPEEGIPEGARDLPRDEETQALVDKVCAFGFPEAFLEESLRTGRFDHAAATFHLLKQQAVGKRAAAKVA